MVELNFFFLLLHLNKSEINYIKIVKYMRRKFREASWTGEKYGENRRSRLGRKILKLEPRSAKEIVEHFVQSSFNHLI